jgi:hypothetical protein
LSQAAGGPVTHLGTLTRSVIVAAPETTDSRPCGPLGGFHSVVL